MLAEWDNFAGEECVDYDLFCDLATGEDGVEAERRDVFFDGDLVFILACNFSFIFLIFSVLFQIQDRTTSGAPP